MSAARPIPECGDGLSVFLSALAGAARPREHLPVSVWADSHRVLSPKGSARAGPWRTARTPYLREILDTLSARSPVQRVVVQSSTQLGKTELGLNWLGYIIDHAPGPALVVLPTVEARRRWVAQRLVPLISDTPRLHRAMDVRRTRQTANSADIKDFAGGILVLGGANSPASLAQMPIRYVLCDEVDRFPWQVGQEGDPLGLIRERMKTFSRRKELLVSTPTVRDASRIEEEFEASDQRRYHLPCPHCGEGLVFGWSNLQWDRHLTRACYVCEHCGSEIEESAKDAMLARGRWTPARPGRRVRGYHLNALYAPTGMGWSWLDLAREWQAVHSDPIKLKRFVNTALGETWEDRSRHVSDNDIAERAEPYRLRTIPPGCLVLTAGVDTQDDRLAVQILGWGRGEVCWVIDWLELPGDPARSPLWTKLAQILNTPIANAYGCDMTIQATAVDTGGHHTHDAYNWIRTRPARRVMAIKGASTPNKALLGGRPSLVDVSAGGKLIRRGLKLWTIGTDTGKHLLFSRLHSDRGAVEEERLIHFSADLDDDYYKQLISEAFDPDRNRWVKRRGRRNEALDTWLYAAAAAHHPEVRVHATRRRGWERLAAALEPDTSTRDEPEAGAGPRPGAQRPYRRGRGRGQHRRRRGMGSEDWHL